MVFYNIVSESQIDQEASEISLRNACEALSLRYERIVLEETNIDDLKDREFEPGLLYKLNITSRARLIEALLSEFHPELTTIFTPKTMAHPGGMLREIREQMSQGLPVIPTRFLDETWLAKSDEWIAERIGLVGGFPVVVKQIGLSHGQGVHLVESAQDLRTLAADLLQDPHSILVRKYLADYRHYRIIVLEGDVAAAIEYHKPDDDFRTNAMEVPDVTPVKSADLPHDALTAAIDAVALRGSIFGGVDILVDEADGRAYIAEVNIPCNFARAEDPTGIHVGKLIVQALMRKHEERYE